MGSVTRTGIGESAQNFAAVATSGSYADLSNTPVLFSGKYGDLTGLPSLFPGTWAALSGRPALFSGAYADLSGLPTLFPGTWAALSGKPSLFSGAYADLTGKPTILSIQAARAQTDSTGTLVWTFATPFAAGVLPIIGALVEDATAGVVFSWRITARSNASVTIQLVKSAVVSVAGISVVAAPVGVQAFVHLIATAPT